MGTPPRSRGWCATCSAITRRYSLPRSGPFPCPALPRLGRLKVPGRVYVGELDDADNQQIAQALAHAAPALELHMVRAAGHFPMLERVGWLPHALAALLDELDARA
jgi:pimeloyl-ACP methyl ester carboxylesterase